MAAGRTHGREQPHEIYSSWVFMGGIPRWQHRRIGSYKGGNAIFMSYVCDRLYRARKCRLDSYEGMPATNKDVDAHNEGDFSGVDLEELRAHDSRLG